MTTVTSRVTGKDCDAEEWQLRVDLAAMFRLAAHFDWHESIANHFSAAVSGDGKTFLLNPRWQHFATIRASDLLLLNFDDPDVMQREDAPDPSAWCIHGNIHANVRHARVLLHCHPDYATALCGLKDPTMKPIDQNTGRFFNRLAIDLGYGGFGDEMEEGLRLAKAFGNHSIMMMGNHGVSVTGNTVAEAFDTLYYLERAAKTMVLAYSTGEPLSIMDDELAEQVAQSWESYPGMSEAHFASMKAMLDRTDPSYRE
ncbi:MAG: class II aldolase/adducin family protein [Hyphomicrobiales bacterium]|nr:class II aldolase/adducin family protein [Hyphomicrobiales bacterium]